ncbi:ABC transporter ATP-binding protein [uncultured Aquincola sp.]|mgnify:CR=1 FL=1|uniref:ABC transporter permease subunit n=1 Tax=uncultured Aquincola sp. TaxID=886556 RepID=UPI0032B255C7|tara:strand:+ start:1135 stop:2319 length:1185 start_codon:yes stop_codon:yes gene_type:complete
MTVSERLIRQRLVARWPLLVIAASGLLAYPFVVAGHGLAWVRMADIAMLYVMLALGLNVVVGFAGLLDLGYIAFYAVGAYTAGLLASPQFALTLASVAAQWPALGRWLAVAFGPEVVAHGLHLSYAVVLPASALLAGLFGMVLGAPTLKLKGDYLAIVTLGFGEIVRIFINNLSEPVNLTDGPKGINLIDPVSVLGLPLHGGPGSGGRVLLGGVAIPSVHAHYLLFLLLCGLMVFATLRLQDSRLGRAFAAIREDELVARAMGLPTHRIKLTAFALGASFGGVAGAFFASFQGFISPESFSMTESIAVLSMVVLGGIGHVPGVVLGAVLLAGLPEVLRHAVEPLQRELFGRVWVEAEVLRQLLFGVSMVVIMLTRPGGLWPARVSASAPTGEMP